MTRDMIFAFLSGVVIGSAGTVAVMKKLGYIVSMNESIENGETMTDEGEASPMTGDKVSFEQPHSLDTYKIRYDSLEEKPDLDDMARNLESEETEVDEEGEYEDEEDDMSDVIPTDEYDPIEHGHVIKQLPARRKDQLIFLIRQEYAGEVYYLEDLAYYELDDVLADVTDAPVDDQLGVIGDSLEYFGQYGADEDKLFVRNCTLGIEYEITKVNSRYADKIYGVDTSKLEKEEPKKQVKKEREEDD